MHLLDLVEQLHIRTALVVLFTDKVTQTLNIFPLFMLLEKMQICDENCCGASMPRSTVNHDVTIFRVYHVINILGRQKHCLGIFLGVQVGFVELQVFGKVDIVFSEIIHKGFFAVVESCLFVDAQEVQNSRDAAISHLLDIPISRRVWPNRDVGPSYFRDLKRLFETLIVDLQVPIDDPHFSVAFLRYVESF